MVVIFGFSNVKYLRITLSFKWQRIFLPTGVIKHSLQMKSGSLTHASKLLVPDADYDTFPISTELLRLKFKIQFNLIELIRAGNREVQLETTPVAHTTYISSRFLTDTSRIFVSKKYTFLLITKCTNLSNVLYKTYLNLNV